MTIPMFGHFVIHNTRLMSGRTTLLERSTDETGNAARPFDLAHQFGQPRAEASDS
jgi:hypothetical protein